MQSNNHIEVYRGVEEEAFHCPHFYKDFIANFPLYCYRNKGGRERFYEHNTEINE